LEKRKSAISGERETVDPFTERAILRAAGEFSFVVV